ncbi:MAG: YdcF family protein [Arcobacteraceae bacterium]
MSNILISPLLFRKIIMQLLFPPGGIILSILLIGVLFLCNKKKLATILMLFLMIFLYLLSSWFGEYIFLRPLEDDYGFLQENTMEDMNLANPVLVVLSGGITEESLSGKAEIGEITLARLYGAYLIYNRSKYPIWVTGGILFNHKDATSSATIMKQVLINLGVPFDNVFIEEKSRTTYENAIFTIEEIKKQGYKEIILVTSALHMRRSVQSFEDDQLTIIPAPVNYLFENKNPGILSILPNRESWEHNLRALHEWIGLLYYRIL